jgi:hypothetical protein
MTTTPDTTFVMPASLTPYSDYVEAHLGSPDLTMAEIIAAEGLDQDFLIETNTAYLGSNDEPAAAEPDVAPDWLNDVNIPDTSLSSGSSFWGWRR